MKEIMQRRQITIEDGCYLIFYTYDDAPSTFAASEPVIGAQRKRREAETQSKAVEERRV